MKRAIAISLLTTALLAGASSWAMSNFFDRYEVMERTLRTTFNYDRSTANAIKHATASADIFKFLREFVGDKNAETAVIQLGVLNEYIERVTHRNDRDSAREIMKDLHNNYAGILAAKLSNESATFPVVLSFAASSTLIVNPTYNPFFEEKEPRDHVVAFGYDWFKEHYREIDNRIDRKIARAKDLQAFNPVQVSSVNTKSTSVE